MPSSCYESWDLKINNSCISEQIQSLEVFRGSENFKASVNIIQDSQKTKVQCQFNIYDVKKDLIWTIIVLFVTIQTLISTNLVIVRNGHKINCFLQILFCIQLNCYIIKWVMEVDETKPVENNVNNHVGNEETFSRNNEVIMNESSLIKNKVCVNSLDVNDIDSKLTEKNVIGKITNGDIVSSCITDLDLIEGSHIETKLKITDIKVEKTEGSNGDLIHDKLVDCNDVNDKLSDDSKKFDVSKEVKQEYIPSVEKKPVEEDSVKEKTKDKEQKNTSSCHVTPNQEKKYNSHRSHHSSASSSSSSSRHRSKDSRDDRHKSSTSRNTSDSSSNHKSSSRDKSKSESSSSSRNKSHSCHHKPEEKCRCKSHHSHRHYKKSKKYESVKIQCNPEDIAYELQQKVDCSYPLFTRVPNFPHPQLAKLKYGKYYRMEVDRNGGASTVHLYMDEISHFTEAQMKECAIEFIKLSYSEDENECAYHVMGIVHGAAAYLPDLVDYMADHYPTLTVKTGSLASRDNHTTTMSQYRDEVYKTYSNGTFRYAPLDQLSICGVLGEEVGAYFPDFVARLEQSPFMKPVMPWSSLSVVQTDNPRESNDGPIFWVRPGEQMLPANEALKEGARPKKRRNNELDNLAYIGAPRSSEARESLFMDRTKAHADQVGVDYGISNTAPTAAVGVLKAVNCGHPEHGNRATKDVVAFHAQDYTELLEILMLDLYEPPQTQCTKWIEVSKLNTLRREGIRYAHIQLHDNDVYYLPRKIIHQFQTISSVASVAWHIRYRDYFSVRGAPNLHHPTGINKGQVFYEKKNVAVYQPPICENDLLAAVTNPGSPGAKTPKKSDKLREYSPFKPSPRKFHKHPASRINVKKEKQSESVPQDDAGAAASKNEVNTPVKDVATPSKKKERSKSEDEKRSNHDESTPKKEQENGYIVKKSENGHRRSSSDHSSSKKREDSDRHSTSRKEVRNLDSDFGHKKDKSRSHSKSKHNDKSERRKSDDSKHNGNSKSRKHEEGKHKHETTPRKSTESDDKDVSSLKRKSNDVVNNSLITTPRIESDDKNDVISLKRKADDVNNSTPKKLKSDDSNKLITDDNAMELSSDDTVKKVDVHNTESNGDNDKNEDFSRVKSYHNDSINHVINFDLRQSMINCDNLITNAAPPPPPVSPPPNPPPPSNSPPPPSNSPPPLPPDSPASSPANVPLGLSKQETGINDTFNDKTVPDTSNDDVYVLNRLQENSIISKDKNLMKKIKKKVMKKPTREESSESYDLLGDIMAKMDKKK